MVVGLVLMVHTCSFMFINPTDMNRVLCNIAVPYIAAFTIKL